MLLWARKFAKNIIEWSFEMGKQTLLATFILLAMVNCTDTEIALPLIEHLSVLQIFKSFLAKILSPFSATGTDN